MIIEQVNFCPNCGHNELESSIFYAKKKLFFGGDIPFLLFKCNSCLKEAALCYMEDNDAEQA